MNVRMRRPDDQKYFETLVHPRRKRSRSIALTTCPTVRGAHHVWLERLEIVPIGNKEYEKVRSQR